MAGSRSLKAMSVELHLSLFSLNAHFLFSKKVKVNSLSRVRLFVTLWTADHQAPLSMGFPRQEYWSDLPFPSAEDLPDPGFKPWTPA